MTLHFASKIDKDQTIDLLRKVMQELLFHGISQEQRMGLLTHLEWMKRQRETLSVNCRLETMPELRLTRITIESSFNTLPPMKARM